VRKNGYNLLLGNASGGILSNGVKTINAFFFLCSNGTNKIRRAKCNQTFERELLLFDIMFLHLET